MRLSGTIICLLVSIVSLSASADTRGCYYPSLKAGPEQPRGTVAAIAPEAAESALHAVVLIPGLNSVDLEHDLYEWKSFQRAWQARAEFDASGSKERDYVLLVYRYDGWQSLYTASRTLAKSLKRALRRHPNIETLDFIGYSQGGLIPRILLSRNPELDSRTTGVFTLATPHQGTIVLSEELVEDILAEQPLPVGLKNRLLLEWFTHTYEAAYREQAWTDFDDGIPPSANYKPPEAALEMPVPDGLHRFRVYGSNDYYIEANTVKKWLALLFREVIPRFFMDRRAGMKELNRYMSHPIYSDEKPRLRDHLRLNDGVVPLASALWARACGPRESPPPGWEELFPTNDFCPTTGHWRAFDRLSHFGWRHPPSPRRKFRDLTSPDAQPKTLYGWIIDDLKAGHRKPPREDDGVFANLEAP